MKAKELLRIIKLVQHAQCKDKKHYLFNRVCGVMLEANSDRAIASATDGKRFVIARSAEPTNIEAGVEIKLWLAGDCVLGAVIDVLKDNLEGDVVFKEQGISVNRMHATCFLNSRFPDFNYTLEQYNEHQYKTETFDSEAFLNNLPRLSKKLSRERPYCLSEEHDVYVNQRYLRELIKGSRSPNVVIAYSNSKGLIKVILTDVYGFIMPTMARPHKFEGIV